MIHVYSKKFLKGVLKIKRLFSFTLIFIICVACVIPIGASAVSFGGLEMRPYLDYVFNADGFSCSGPTIASVIDGNLGIQEADLNFFGNQDNLRGVSILAQSVVVSEFEHFNEAEVELMFDFVDATVGDEDFRPTHFDFQYAPFTCLFRDMFQYTLESGNRATLDALTLYDTIGATCGWYGAKEAYVSGEFEMRVSFVKQQVDDSIHNLYLYTPLTHVYRFSFQNFMDDYFSFAQIDFANLNIYDDTDNETITFSEFYSEVYQLTSTMRTDLGYAMADLYIDIEALRLDIDISNAPFSALIQLNAPYINPDGFDYLNGLFWDPNDGNYAFRQQARGSYVAVMSSTNLNKDVIINVDFDGDYNNPLVRVPALFLSAVGDFFAIDFFGLGITLGHLTFVAFLASVVLIYLKFFAGG